MILGQLGDDSIVTMGKDTPYINYEEEWKEFLAYNKMQHVLGVNETTRKKSHQQWHADIPVIAYVVTIKDAAGSKEYGLLHTLVQRYQSGGCSFDVFALPAVQAIVDLKWTSFGRKILMIECAFFMLWLASFYVFTVAFQDEDASLSFRELLQTRRGQITIVSNILSLVGMFPFVIIEISTLSAYGIYAWGTAYNLLDTTTYIFQILITVMHFGRIRVHSSMLSIAAALQAVLLLFRLQYFSRVFKHTRFSFVEDIKEVLKDVKWYLVFLTMIILGYSTAFHILFRYDQTTHQEFASFAKAFIKISDWAFAGPELSELYQDTRNPVVACALGLSFAFIMGMILINLLIGLMTTSLEKVTSNQDMRSFSSKAQVIDEIEWSLPPFILARHPQYFPRYVHVLRVDPDKIDRVKFQSLWLGGDDANDSQDHNPSADNITELKSMVANLSSEISDIKQILVQLTSSMQQRQEEIQ